MCVLQSQQQLYVRKWWRWCLRSPKGPSLLLQPVTSQTAPTMISGLWHHSLTSTENPNPWMIRTSWRQTHAVIRNYCVFVVYFPLVSLVVDKMGLFLVTDYPLLFFYDTLQLLVFMFFLFYFIFVNNLMYLACCALCGNWSCRQLFKSKTVVNPKKIHL